MCGFNIEPSETGESVNEGERHSDERDILMNQMHFPLLPFRLFMINSLSFFNGIFEHK